VDHRGSAHRIHVDRHRHDKGRVIGAKSAQGAHRDPRVVVYELDPATGIIRKILERVETYDEPGPCTFFPEGRVGQVAEADAEPVAARAAATVEVEINAETRHCHASVEIVDDHRPLLVLGVRCQLKLALLIDARGAEQCGPGRRRKKVRAEAARAGFAGW
jgi:hypothetical protein